MGLVLGHDGHVHGGSGGHVLAELVDQLTLLDSPEAGCDKLIGQPSVGHGPILVPSDPPCV